MKKMDFAEKLPQQANLMTSVSIVISISTVSENVN
jgi:hypothetical protein